jgi:hypothetical protein
MRAVHINCLQWKTIIYANSLTNLHVLHIVVTASISDDITTFLIFWLLYVHLIYLYFLSLYPTGLSNFRECKKRTRNQ